jgi:CheY-like chemotaxis protein
LLGTLASEGFFVHGVGTGPEVLERTVLERPDAVAVKLTLPGMSGDTVAATLKQMPNVKNIPVVIFDDAGGLAARRRVAAVTGGSCRFVEGTDAAALSEALKESLA